MRYQPVSELPARLQCLEHSYGMLDRVKPLLSPSASSTSTFSVCPVDATIDLWWPGAPASTMDGISIGTVSACATFNPDRPRTTAACIKREPPCTLPVWSAMNRRVVPVFTTCPMLAASRQRVPNRLEELSGDIHCAFVFQRHTTSHHSETLRLG